jgi:hypothetical protein
MKSAKEREAEFRADLAALLAKHKGELDITNEGPYSGYKAIAEVTLHREYDADGNQTGEYATFSI